MDGLALRPREDNLGFFDDQPNHQVGLWGVYASRPAPPKTSVELYYLGLDKKQATFQRARLRRCVNRSGDEYPAPLRPSGPDGTLTMKLCGSSVRLVRGTFERGRSLPKPAIDLQIRR
jgi:hypothetical protein